ncbi:MAG: PEGA domain-containing protein [Fibrobacter sp.]|nr:PEGA domain-containing protein [Fibrobacter sp.]
MIKPFVVNISDSLKYQQIHLALLKRLEYEIFPKAITLACGESSQNSSVVAEGVIDTLDGTEVLIFRLSGNEELGKEEKLIPLRNNSIEELVDIMALKIRYFLDQNISGKLRISSRPLNCDVLLNGIKIGVTPAELVLEKGQYNIGISREHLYPWYDSVLIEPGREKHLNPSLEFEGHTTRPFVYSSAVLTLATIVTWVIESRAHDSYKNLPDGLPQSDYNRKWNRYRNANYIRIGLLNASIIGWTIGGFQWTRNRSLERKIFGQN